MKTPTPELEAHIDRFCDEYLSTEKGLLHVASYLESRLAGRRNFETIVHAAAKGDDVTDDVLLKLLPHQSTPYNRGRGAWTHIAPAVTRDL